MKSTRIALAIAALACTLSVPAVAAPITLNASIGGLLSGAQQGRFDASSVLNGNYKINSLSYSFNFADDGDMVRGNPTAGAATNYTNYLQVGSNGLINDPDNRGETIVTRSFSRDVTNYKNVQGLDQQESAVLSLAGIQVGSGATKKTEWIDIEKSAVDSRSQPTNKIAGFEKCDSNGNNCSWQQGKWDYYTDNVKTETKVNNTAWTGIFDISGVTTNETIIQQLLGQKYLDFGLALTGDLFLSSANITLDVTEIPAEVPEPSTVLLMLAALGGLGYSMRRRSAKK